MDWCFGNNRFAVPGRASFQKPAAPLAKPKPLPPAPMMLESFEGMLCRRGISIRAARALIAAGYDSFTALEKASDVELLAIKGVGPETVKKSALFTAQPPPI